MHFRSLAALATLAISGAVTLPASLEAAPQQGKPPSSKSALNPKPKDAQAEANKDFAHVSEMVGQYTKDGKLGVGVAEMTRRLKGNPHDVDALLCKALLEARMQNQTEALADMNQAIKQKPNLYYAYLLRSGVEEMGGHVDRALADITKAYEISHYDDLLRARGQIHFRAKNYKAAIADLSKGLDKSKRDSTKSYYYLYQSHLQLKDWKNATQDAQAIVDIDPRRANGYELLADVADLSGDKKTALTAYRRASQLYLDQGENASSNDMMNKANRLEQSPKSK